MRVSFTRPRNVGFTMKLFFCVCYIMCLFTDLHDFSRWRCDSSIRKVCSFFSMCFTCPCFCVCQLFSPAILSFPSFCHCQCASFCHCIGFLYFPFSLWWPGATKLGLHVCYLTVVMCIFRLLCWFFLPACSEDGFDCRISDWGLVHEFVFALCWWVCTWHVSCIWIFMRTFISWLWITSTSWRCLCVVKCFTIFV